MGGHNKWSQIKRQKEKADSQKSNLWAKLGKRIAVESKKSRGDVNAANLRSAIDIAKKANMPKENIERAVVKGTSKDAIALESVAYEVYGPGGAAIVISALTDNRNRTSAELKHLLSKYSLALATPGSALWAFEKTPEGYTPKTPISLSDDDNKTLMAILEEIDAHDDVENVFTNAE